MKFVRSQFNYHGGYLHYTVNASEPTSVRFIARFKHVPGNRSGFVKFLSKHFTVEEYLARIDAGEAPLTILESKGYVCAHILKWLATGQIPTWKGFDYAYWQQRQ